MAAEQIIIDKKMRSFAYRKCAEIDDRIRAAYKAGHRITASIPNGKYKGSVGQLLVGDEGYIPIFKQFYRNNMFNRSEEGTFFNTSAWELTIDGHPRKLTINWHNAFKRIAPYDNQVVITLDDTNPTILKSTDVAKAEPLVDFFGQLVEEGDFVMMNSNAAEFAAAGNPFRLLRYTGERSPKAAKWKYVKMNNETGKGVPKNMEVISVGLSNKAGQEHRINGIKLSVDPGLETAIQVLDFDMTTFPLCFSVGFDNK